ITEPKHRPTPRLRLFSGDRVLPWGAGRGYLPDQGGLAASATSRMLNPSLSLIGFIQLEDRITHAAYPRAKWLNREISAGTRGVDKMYFQPIRPQGGCNPVSPLHNNHRTFCKLTGSVSIKRPAQAHQLPR